MQNTNVQKKLYFRYSRHKKAANNGEPGHGHVFALPWWALTAYNRPNYSWKYNYVRTH